MMKRKFAWLFAGGAILQLPFLGGCQSVLDIVSGPVEFFAALDQLGIFSFTAPA